ncbi:hypothetical conserved protein [Candidatus Nitrosoglobus terrae]|uniref:Hypothetical conserved protein n=1 Tax=Candidatus Nitrosoglobus terrae TaxID=1630141 RepID=A0A1Q2SPW3_9GAMM|nr:hypothetical protein [Candidatus Nitrosoglobus terrae]BAW81156.1 hypothetical conserved protein [Candidatus Nitrosoglobus terrae]
MVTKADFLKYAADQAIDEAHRQNLEPAAIKILIAEAQTIIEDIFLSIHWATQQEDATYSKEALSAWNHRSLDEREADWRYLSFTQDLEHAVERYLQTPWLHCSILDWLIIDILIYKDYLTMLDTIRGRTMPLSRYQSKKSGKTTFRVLAELWRTGLFILKIAAWFTIFAAVSPVSPAGPLLWIALTIGWLGRKWVIWKKNNAILKRMFAIYTIFNPAHQDWRKLWEELKQSQKLGALWDNLVYQLVEKKMKSV